MSPTAHPASNPQHAHRVFEDPGAAVSLALVHAADRIRSEVAGAGYGLVAFFDCLHDMDDPIGAAGHVRRALGGDGSFLVVEKRAPESPATDLHPVGRAWRAFSGAVPASASPASGAGPGLADQAKEARIREVLTQAGFSRIRRAAQTPNHMVIEARP